jgi:hypothetical protein
MEETLTLTRFGVSRNLKRTLESTNLEPFDHAPEVTHCHRLARDQTACVRSLGI